MKEVLVFMADGTEEIEALTVVDLLRRVNIPVSMVSVNNAEYVTGSHAITVKMDMGISAVNLENVGMIVLPGGMPGTNKLMDSEKLTKMIHTFAEEGKYLAAICAAPSILGVNDLLEGKKATCYPGFEEKLLGAKCVKEPVAVDGNIITSRGLGTAIEFAAAIVSALLSPEDADNLLNQIIYK